LIDWSSPELLSLVAAAALGAAVVTSKIGLRDISALSGACISVPTTAVLLWCLAPGYLDLTGWQSDAVLIFALIGLFFPALVTILNFEANNRMGPTVASTVGSVTPLFAVAAAILLLSEAPSPITIAGIVAVVIGVMALSTQGGGVSRNWPLWILLIPLIGAAVRGTAQAVAKVGLTIWPNWFAAVLIGYTISAAVILFVAFGPLASRRSAFQWRAVPWFALAGILNGAGMLLMYAALNSGAVATVASIVAIYPAITFILSAIFLRDENLTAFSLIGVALTLLGVILVTQG
jgi:uncharacterized membrane protein